MEKTMVIGPFRFLITAEEQYASLLNIEGFDMQSDIETEDFTVSVVSTDWTGIKGDLVYEGEFFDVYKEGNNEHRYCHQNVDGEKRCYMHNCLCGNQITVEFYNGVYVFGRTFEIWRYFFLEKLLLEKDGIILHSSSILWNNGVLLFSAPSGTGKSTQANLWKKYENAEGVNGDRNLLIRYQGRWYCAGIPWHGSSTDCRNIFAPVRCISIIRQSPADEIAEISVMSRIKYLFSEITRNSWDASDVEKALGLVESLVMENTVVQLNCTMNRSAVECLKKRLEEEIWKS